MVVGTLIILFLWINPCDARGVLLTMGLVVL